MENCVKKIVTFLVVKIEFHPYLVFKCFHPFIPQISLFDEMY
jgi:hypothetical protein